MIGSSRVPPKRADRHDDQKILLRTAGPREIIFKMLFDTVCLLKIINKIEKYLGKIYFNANIYLVCLVRVYNDFH